MSKKKKYRVSVHLGQFSLPTLLGQICGRHIQEIVDQRKTTLGGKNAPATSDQILEMHCADCVQPPGCQKSLQPFILKGQLNQVRQLFRTRLSQLQTKKVLELQWQTFHNARLIQARLRDVRLQTLRTGKLKTVLEQQFLSPSL